MIGTLMEAARPGQSRPTTREAASLAVSGLRARAGLRRAQSRADVWRGAVRLSVLLLLLHATAASLAWTGRLVGPGGADAVRGAFWLGEFQSWLTLIRPLETVVAAAALVAVAAGRYLLGILATVGALVAAVAINTLPFMITVDPFSGEVSYFTAWPDLVRMTLEAPLDEAMWPLPLAVLLTVPLIRWRTTTAARPLAWLLAVPAATILLPTSYDTTVGLQPWGLVGVCTLLLAWAAIDARVPIAGSALLIPAIGAPTVMTVARGATAPTAFTEVWFWTFVATAVLLFTTGAIRVRQQVRL